ncbi:lycopene cyclase domain-containing protein [Actinotalea sp. M2MS4P-6]|uniref:lycopene cyclase domain-containing protein n=1 Tax=Actinotalea sp. M2MS4P-6 TaxID=2983762 RepID=UPI0021E3C8FE|nr:lycopene cyclase domain-containing protein [Actinotalea sp. M2MS4P-6]MCV2393028.1 lycopene cyclase domain-containing protein [Actinotalea sp. M2MS4P-6]
MTLAYPAALVLSLAGMLVVDRRWRLVLFRRAPHAARRGLGALAVGVAFFLLWDLAGIRLGIFFVGDGAYQSGLLLAPDLPVEEVGFLLLLSHLSLVLAAVAERIAARYAARSAASGGAVSARGGR